MSIKVMTDVWTNSKHKEGSLLVLLAIADFADDAGFAYPGQDTLAKKARLSRRQVIRVIQLLIQSGELTTKPSRSNYGTLIYQVRCVKMSQGSDVTLAQNKAKDDVTFETSDVTSTSQYPSVFKPSVKKEKHQKNISPISPFSKKGTHKETRAERKYRESNTETDWDRYVQEQAKR